MSWDKDIKKLFKEESLDSLSALESFLLELEQRPEDKELVMEVFRTFHTIKGSGGMCGFKNIADFTHEIETVFDMVRNSTLDVTKELIDTTLKARDFILDELRRKDGEEDDFDRDTAQAIVQKLKTLVQKQGAIEEDRSETDEDKLQPSAPGTQKSYRIRFHPHREIFTDGTNPILLLKELRSMGDCRIFAHTNDVPLLKDFNHEFCYTYWDILLTTSSGVDAIKDVFIFLSEKSTVTIDIIDEDWMSAAETDYKKLGEILLDRKDISTEDLKKILKSKKNFGDLLIDTGLIDQSTLASALAEQEQIRKIRKSREKAVSSASMRVASEKLDVLVDLVGELVTTQARLTQTALTQKNPDVLLIAEALERITENLRDNTLNLRMVPIGTTFSHFRRLVRDLSKELGKEVQLTTEGADTELDKTVIEKLHEPLVHLIRNCIDHGIETPEERESAGKWRVGRVHLSAAHSGNNVLIQIHDDGRGIDSRAIREKAVKQGIISEKAELQGNEINDLIFSNGFTTSRNITSVSGRGVGMDIVKKSIETLRGSIHISTDTDKGTLFTLKLPLTLAIIEGLLVQVLNENYVIPLSIVKECVELAHDKSTIHNSNIANVRGAMIPYVRLRDHFSLAGEAPLREQIVITEPGMGKVGIVVDRVIGGNKTVIKTLGRVYQDSDGISGATILGDGTVALILDVQKIIDTVSMEREEVKSF